MAKMHKVKAHTLHRNGKTYHVKAHMAKNPTHKGKYTLKRHKKR